MKCNDCGNLGWGDDEGELVYGWCRVRQYCPDLGIERDCSSFLKKRPDALSTDVYKRQVQWKGCFPGGASGRSSASSKN